MLLTISCIKKTKSIQKFKFKLKCHYRRFKKNFPVEYFSFLDTCVYEWVYKHMHLIIYYINMYIFITHIHE